MNGWKVCRPDAAARSGGPTTCGRSGTPSSAASPARSSSRASRRARRRAARTRSVTGRCVSAASRRIQSSSLSGADMSSPWMPAGASSNTPRPTSAERLAEREQLVLGGERAGHRLAVDGAGARSCATWRSRARRRRSPRATMPAIAAMSSARRRLVARAALAHHVGAHRAVRHLRADVERERRGVERVEVLGEGLPLPVDALVQRGAGDVLDALHQLDEPVAPLGRRPARSRRRSCPSRRVVTPCQLDGVSIGSQVTWPS